MTFEYTEDFELAWKAYNAPKGSSKTIAQGKWDRLGKDRPGQELMLAMIAAYNNWLTKENEGRHRGREHPKCHFATWLFQRRYESFEDDAQGILASRKLQDGHSQADEFAIAKSWAGQPLASLKAAANGEFAAMIPWISKTVFFYRGPMGTIPPNIPIPHIESPSQFHRDELERRFGKVIRQAFGPDVILSVAKKNGPA